MSNDGLSSLICHACVGMALSSRMCCAAEAHVVRHILRHRCKRKWQTALRYDRHVRHGCKSCCLLHLPRCALNNRAVRCVWRAHVYVKTSHECAESRVLTKQADTHTHDLCSVPFALQHYVFEFVVPCHTPQYLLHEVVCLSPCFVCCWFFRQPFRHGSCLDGGLSFPSVRMPHIL